MTETVPNFNLFSDFISDIVSSLKLYFRRDTREKVLVAYFCDM